jgi:hypothetical protein
MAGPGPGQPLDEAAAAGIPISNDTSGIIDRPTVLASHIDERRRDHDALMVKSYRAAILANVNIS